MSTNGLCSRDGGGDIIGPPTLPIDPSLSLRFFLVAAAAAAAPVGAAGLVVADCGDVGGLSKIRMELWVRR